MPDMPTNFKCPQCGAGIRIGRHYCPQCGAKVDVQFDEIEKAVSFDKAADFGDKIGGWARTVLTGMLFLSVVIFGVKDCYSPRTFIGDANDFVTVTPPNVQSVALYKPEALTADYQVRTVDPKHKGTTAWPFAYRLDANYRQTATEARGGDYKRVSDLVTSGLSFLAGEQNPDGSFPVELFAKKNTGRKIQWFPDTWAADIKAGRDNDCTPIGATGLAALCFLGNGDVDLPQARGLDRNKPVAGKAVKWLLAQQDPATGAFGKKNPHWCLNHAQATMAAIEYCGLTRNRDNIEPACQKAVDFLLTMLDPSGGFAYVPKSNAQPNLEATAWALMALATAREAGLKIADEQKAFSTTATMLANLRGMNGAVAFAPDQMAQAGTVRDWMGMYLTSVMLLSGTDNGKSKDDVVQKFAAPVYNPAWINPWEQNTEPAKASISSRSRELRPNDYFFATMAMRYYGGPEWNLWQKAMFKVLELWKDPDHSFRANDDLIKSRGLVWSTALCILSAESYYRVP